MFHNFDKYQELVTLIDQFQADVTTGITEASQLRPNLVQLLEFFRGQIVPLADTDAQERSYRTEISKQLRLLEVDVMFLQGSRQPATAQTRLRSIVERLNTLERYCQTILQIGKNITE
jgi:hypothetical protein